MQQQKTLNGFTCDWVSVCKFLWCIVICKAFPIMLMVNARVCVHVCLYIVCVLRNQSIQQWISNLYCPLASSWSWRWHYKYTQYTLSIHYINTNRKLIRACSAPDCVHKTHKHTRASNSGLTPSKMENEFICDGILGCRGQMKMTKTERERFIQYIWVFMCLYCITKYVA